MVSNTNQNIYKFIPYKIEKIEFKNKINKKSKIPKIPIARSGHRTVCTDGNLYSLGGFNPENVQNSRSRRTISLFQELWKFNFATREWKLCLNYNTKDMPEELASNAVTLKNNYMIAFGGTSYPFGETCSNQCYIFNLDKKIINVKRIKVNGDLPIPQYGPAIIIYDNYLYTIGGTTGFEYSCDVYRLNLLTNIWECVYLCKNDNNNDEPNGRYRHEIVYFNETIYILGGGTAQTAFDLIFLPAFNIKKNLWYSIETKPDKSLINHCGYPGPRKCHSCIQYINDNNNIEVIIAGGNYDINNYYSDIWKLNLNTMEWKLLKTANLPKPIYFHSASTSGNGCMYLFGGIEMNNNNLIRTNNLLKIWTTIPKLSEIAWDSICYYNSNLNKYKKNELLKFGIPRKFVNRITEDNC